MGRYSGVAYGLPDPFVLGTVSRWSVGDVMVSNGQTVSSAIYPTASLAFFYPIEIVRAKTFLRAMWMNGTVVSGNVDIGVYTLAGAKLFTLGTTAQAGVTTVQVSNAISWALNPGRYFLAFVCDNITATFVRLSPSVTSLRAAGCRQLASAFVLPADVSAWVGMTGTAFAPVAGLTELATI